MKTPKIKPTIIAAVTSSMAAATQSTSVWHITPELAAGWLEQNTTDNRVVRTAWVNLLADAIRKGQWRLTHQGIAFDTKGQLVDGQHRLWAIIEAGTAVDMAVTTGVEPKAFTVFDIGAKRTLADSLNAPQKTIEVCARICRFMKGSGPTPADVAPYLAKFGSATDQLHERVSEMRRGVSVASIRAGAVIRMVQRPADTEHVLDVYSRLIKLNFTDAPPVVTAMFRGFQVANRSFTQHDTMLRAWRGFSPGSANLTRIQMSNAENTAKELTTAIDRLMAS